MLPPFAITKANSPPEEDNPIAERKDITLSIFWSLADTNTVANFAPIETIIKTIAGIIKSGINLKSMRAPTETKNNAAKISLTGVDKTDAIACDFDSAINTPAKKFLLLLKFLIQMPKKPFQKPNLHMLLLIHHVDWFLPQYQLVFGIVLEPNNKTPPIKAKVIPIDKDISQNDTFPVDPTD